MKNAEHEIQKACVTWFRLQYPRFKNRLFAIPNGGLRSIKTAARLKAEGVTAGVWDLFFAEPDLYRDLGGLFIEIKAGQNKLSKAQKAFQEDLKTLYAFEVCYSLDDFIRAIKRYVET